MTASLSARSRWASRRAGSPVIHWLVPSGAAVRPSSVPASLSTTYGRPVRRCLRYGASWARTVVRAHAGRTSMPAAPQLRDARAGDVRVGVLDADDDPGDARGDDRVDARRGAAVVRAGLERGDERSRPRAVAPAARERDDLGVGTARRLGGAVERGRRPAASTTQPTHGFGERATCERPRRARWLAASAARRSLRAHGVLVRSHRSVAVRSCTRTRARRPARAGRRSAPSLPSGLTACRALHDDSGTPSALGFHQVGQGPKA